MKASMPDFGSRLLTVLALFLAAACTPPAELDGDDLEPTFGWDELVVLPDASPLPDPAGEDQAVVPPGERLLLTPERLRTLPHFLQRDQALAAAALTVELPNPSPWRGGAFGSNGPTKQFVGLKSAIPDRDRLYWVAVAMLSEKYGCFLRSRVRQGNLMLFQCRDRRQILLESVAGKDWFQIKGRQFDRDGYQIEVRNRHIVRVSPKPVI